MADQETIVNALAQLDSGNPGHWTDDGLPRIDVIRSLANDQSIKRQDINSAKPGFSRAGTEANKEPADVLPGEPSEAEETAALKAGDETGGIEDDGLGELAGGIKDEELREIMKSRVAEAEDRLNRAREAVSEAQAYLHKCEGWHRKAVADLGKRFPPISASQAIKDHLMRTAEHRLASNRGFDDYRRGLRKVGYRALPNNFPVATRPVA